MVGSGPHQSSSHQPELARSQQQATFLTPSMIEMKKMEGFEREVYTPLKPAKAILVWAITYYKDKTTTWSCNQKKLGVMYNRDRTISGPYNER